jgi:hypothetical protein
LFVAVAVAVAAFLVAPEAGAQDLGKRFSLDELNHLVADATLVVRAKATAEPVAVGGDEKGASWKIPCQVVEVLKGKFAEKTLELRVQSPIDELGTARKAVPGTEYILPLVPLEKAKGPQFRLAGGAGFAVGSPEALKVADLARGGPATGTLTPLRLRIDAPRPYPVGQPALLRIIIDNPSKSAAIYEQAPVELREGTLYLTGAGRLDVTDGRGNSVAPKASVREGGVPPAPPTPKTIPAERNFQTEIDLAQFFDLSRAGNYMVSMVLDSSDGKEQLKSSVINLQIIPAVPVSTAEPVVKPTGPKAIRIPSPDVYEPGTPVNGLAALLKPIRPEFAVGEKILVEFRLINAGEQPMLIDTRLERSLLVTVTAQADSPVVRPFLQRINWPEDDPKDKDWYLSYLRPLAFWGKLVDINSVYGRSEESLLAQAPATAPRAEVDYEKYGLTLFSFDSPGVYKIQVSYVVKPRGGEGPKVWASKLASNPIFVRILAAGKPSVRGAPVATPESSAAPHPAD